MWIKKAPPLQERLLFSALRHALRQIKTTSPLFSNRFPFDQAGLHTSAPLRQISTYLPSIFCSMYMHRSSSV